MTQQRSTLLLAAALVAGMAATADAQQPHPGGGRPAAPAARPAAPHFAPAPRMAAPQMSAPRMSAPHMSAPRMAAPQMAPRMAQPRMQPRVATPHIKRATDGNATHSAFADGQPDRPATAVPTGTTPATRITSAAAVGAGTFQRAGADETANAGTAADEFT